MSNRISKHNLPLITTVREYSLTGAETAGPNTSSVPLAVVPVPVKAHHNKPRFKKYTVLAAYLPLALALSLTGVLLVGLGSSHFNDFINIALGLTIETLPFLLLGGLVAAVIAVWSNHTWTARLNRLGRTRAVLAAVGLGLVIPVCECGSAPVARQVTRQGAPVTLSLVFLFAAPVVNPVTILVTALAFGGDWAMVLGRVALGVLVACAVGLLFSLHPRPRELFNSQIFDNDNSEINQSQELLHSHNHDHGEGTQCHQAPAEKLTKLNQLVDRTILEFFQAVRVALPGIIMAAALQAFIGSRYLLEAGQGALLSAVALMVVAGLLSLCSSVDAFVALSFTALFPTGSVLAFLVFGPVLNLKNLFLLRLVLRWRTIGLAGLLAFQIILVTAVFINLRLN